MALTNVAVLRGGPSPLYNLSLQTGSTVINALNEERYKVRDILITKDGEWHSRGIPVGPERALRGIDVVFIALHGEYAEDGAVQRLLETYGIPYTGSRAFGTTLAFDKDRTRMHMAGVAGIKVPQHIVVHIEEAANSLASVSQRIFSKFGPAYIIKPLRGGASIGVTKAHTLSELPVALYDAFQYSESVIVEQFIEGREATCGVVEHMRDNPLYTLPPVEIKLPPGSWHYDFETKYNRSADSIAPGNFNTNEKERMQFGAQAIHQALGLKHYSRSDFIVAPSGIYFLEVNTLPEIMPDALLPKSLESIGMPLPDFLDHIITLALVRHG